MLDGFVTVHACCPRWIGVVDQASGIAIMSLASDRATALLDGLVKDDRCGPRWIGVVDQASGNAIMSLA